MTIVTALDHFRVSLLRWTLQYPWIRAIFVNRSLRLQLLFIAAAGFYLFFSLYFPLWVLVIGPIIWGIPHIFASIRYLPRAINKDSFKLSLKNTNLIKLLLGLWAIVTILRILMDQMQINLTGATLLPSNWPELSAATLTVFAIAWFLRRDFRSTLSGLLIFLPVVIFSWLTPLVTAGLLIILHNWIAFFYWFKFSKSKSERRVVGFSFFVFAAVHALILAGAFDVLYQFYPPQGYHSWAELDYSDLGKMIAPGSIDSHLWFHLVSIYAFGQAIHYFIWLKAIPDQELPVDYPVSFQLSLSYLNKDFGVKTVRWIGMAILAGIGVWVLFKLPQARALYFSIAAFHGYMELAGLGFLKFAKVER